MSRNCENLQEIKEQLMSIWNECAVFDVDEVGFDDDFFQIGGNSIYAIRVVVKIKEIYDVDISSKVFFENPTVNKLSLIIYNLVKVLSIDEDGEGEEFEI
jgi:acyl carrier protein